MIEFYIKNQKIDLTNTVDISLNSTNDDWNNPTAVKVSYSKTITLEGTQTNNKIFSSLYRLDSTNFLDFDTSIKNDAVILNNGILIDSGYVTLDKITINSGVYKYDLTFYSSLGQFFYNLKYGNDDEEKTLYDLYYGFEINGTQLTREEEDKRILMQWTKDYITDSWDELFSPLKRNFNNLHTKDIRHLITAASTYSGFYDDFEGNKVMSNNPSDNLRQAYRIEQEQWDRTKNQQKDWILFEAPRELDENECNDLRSLYQRPAIKVKTILDAISDPSNNGGFNVKWPEEMKSIDNALGCYYNLTWIIKDRFSFDDYNPSTEYDVRVDALVNTQNNWMLFNENDTIDTSLFVNPKIQVALNVNIPYSEDITKAYNNLYLSHYKNGPGRTYFTSLIEYDFFYNNESHKYILCDFIPSNPEEFRSLYFPSLQEGYFDNATFLECKFSKNELTGRFINETELLIDLPDIPKSTELKIEVRQKAIYAKTEAIFTEVWVNEDETQDYLDKGYDFVLVEYSADDVTEWLPDRRYVGEMYQYRMGRYIYTDTDVKDGIYPNLTKDKHKERPITERPFYSNVHTLFDNNKDDNYFSVLYDTIKSNVQNVAIDKKLLFSGTGSPLDYLLNFTKLLNLKFVYDKLSNTINIIPWERYYTGKVVSLDGKIDKKSDIIINPNFWGNKIFKYQLPTIDTYSKYLYEKKTGHDYLAYTYNTNNEILEGTSEVFSELIFNSVSDFNQQSVYYDGYNETILTKGNIWKINLIKDNSTETKDVWFNRGYKALDPISKICLFDEDNGTVDDTISFVFLGSCIYHPFGDLILSDNLDIMFELNGQACYLDAKGDQTGYPSKNAEEKVTLFRKPLYVPYFSQYLLDKQFTYINSSVLYKQIKATLSTSLIKPEYTTLTNIDLSECRFIFEQFHKQLLDDWFNKENKSVECKVQFTEYSKLSDLMRNFYYFDGCLWRLNKITDLDIIETKTCKCEFIKIIDKLRYGSRNNTNA